FAYTDWAYRSTYNMFLYEAKEYKAKSLLEGGLRVGYKWDNYEVAAFARNITDKVQTVAAIDFDKDGRPDLAIGQNGTETKLFRNTHDQNGTRRAEAK
ncbi:MAG: FG-GAP repeat protein, partial [Limisphaerales bacterium]